MKHLRAAGRGRQCRAAGIGKQVQHPHRPTGAGHLFPDEIPVGRLLRENAGMLEIHGFDVKGQVVLIANLPPLGQGIFRPVAAAGIGADIAGIVLLPLGSPAGGIPDYLGIRTHQDMTAPAFQPFAAGGIEHLIVLPFIGNPQHVFTPLLLIYLLFLNGLSRRNHPGYRIRSRRSHRGPGCCRCPCCREATGAPCTPGTACRWGYCGRY